MLGPALNLLRASLLEPRAKRSCTRNAANMFYPMTTVQYAFMHSINAPSLLHPPSGVVTQIRCKVRNNFPRPKETKRIKIHGWRTRMSTLEGRKILMRRILKGKHVLSH
ncbi:uncharacterized protein LOC126281725 [Schistocerca gregaria]|uniref:uncharacterized protein LOC126281725 n=1 Tax=Schistocerca gregaria TaxID=7010 RepID=UPI00211DE3DD|nr:uncharacterized protein LOC126281725 [Schistocerca gregaria]